MNQICKHCEKPLIRKSDLKTGDDPCTCYGMVIKQYDRRPSTRKETVGKTTNKKAKKKVSKKK